MMMMRMKVKNWRREWLERDKSESEGLERESEIERAFFVAGKGRRSHGREEVFQWGVMVMTESLYFIFRHQII
ncbi:hypothetical protein Hanom_Chr03g00230261 [Helianthus anomalus]